MPEERGYESQVAPSAAPVGPLASPEVFGAGVGSSLRQLGGTIHEAKIREYQIERRNKADSEWLDFQRKFALQRENFDGIVRHMRSNAAAGAQGHAEGIKANWAEVQPGLLDGITDNDVRRKAEATLLDYGGKLISQEGDWQEGRRVAKVTDDFQQATTIAANRARHAQDKDAFAAELTQAYAAIDGMQNVDADTKAKLHRFAEQNITIGFVNGLIDTQPQMAKAMIDAGAFDYLDAGDLDKLRSGSEVEIRRVEAAAEHEAALQRADFNQKIATASGYVAQGVEIPDGQLDALHEQAVALGDSDTAVKIEGWKADNKFAKIYRASTPVLRQNRIAELNRKNNRSIDEDRELEWLRTKGSSLDSEQKRDGVGYWARNGTGGMVPPPLDPSDPKSLQVRAAWAQRMTQTTGTAVGIFSEADLGPYQEALKTTGGRKEVLGQLDVLPVPLRAKAAKEIAPQDFVFQHEAQLRPGVRDFVYLGKQAKTANPKILHTDPKTEAGRNAAALLNEAGGDLDFVLRDMEPADRDAVSQIAELWLAGRLAQEGRDVNSITRRDVGTALLVALGGYARDGGKTPVGGIGRWSGGKAFVIPEGYTQQEFGHAVTIDARAKAKKGTGPVNPDGTPFDLNQAYPRFMGGGRYRWLTRGGSPVRRKDGSLYISEVAPR